MGCGEPSLGAFWWEDQQEGGAKRVCSGRMTSTFIYRGAVQQLVLFALYSMRRCAVILGSSQGLRLP